MLGGSCLCGKIRYGIEGGPRFMYQCHCSRCRAATGAAFAANVIVDAEKFKITAGKEFLAGFESSPKKYRYFCSSCGSPIYSHGEKTKHIVSVRCGTLDQDPGLRPAYHAFAASKAAWDDICDKRPQFVEWADPELMKWLFDAADR
jgi:hypothetical protein